MLFVLVKGQTFPDSTVDPLLSMSILELLSGVNLQKENIKVVHLVRDPRTFVTSFMNWKSSSIKKKILHYFIPFWQPTPVFDKNISFIEKLKYNKFKQFCYVWRYKNHIIYNSLHLNNNYVIVRMEDIIKSADRDENLLKLLKFLDLDIHNFNYDEFSSHKINKSEKNIFPKYEYWPMEYKEYLYNTCGKLMKQFGYH